MSTGRLRLVMAYLAIAANSLSAGGIFMFPILSPTFASVLKLTQPQLTTVSVAGLIGQYPFAPVVGKVLDLYGPQTCSTIAAVFFFIGFSCSALELAFAPHGIMQPSTSSFCRLTLYFFMAGLATVFSYFSSIFAATKMMPHRTGLASGSSMAIFGLSPLFLSTLSTTFFVDPFSGSLRTIPFLTFLALFTLTTHGTGTLIYRRLKIHKPVAVEQLETIDENSSLLPPKRPDEVQSELFPDPLKDWSFPLLAFCTLVVVGSCEMVMSNLGSIVLSLPPNVVFGSAYEGTTPAGHVKLLSIANTTSRLVIGPLADYLSPSVQAVRPPQALKITRVAFLTGTTFFLVVAFLWMETFVKSREDLWLLSVSVGISYGAIFTILPGIVSAIWGAADLGRNFGIITYAPFIGTPLFSFLYAYVSTIHSKGEDLCVGPSCWRTTFWFSFGTSMLALCGSIVLWRKWIGKL